MAHNFEIDSLMKRPGCVEDSLRMAVLLSGLSDFIAEFQLIDPADLIAFAQYDNLSNIADLVTSSAELSLKPGILAFGWVAGVDIAWRKPPVLVLELEFSHDGITVFFALRLGAFIPTIVLHMISFADEHEDQCVNTIRLMQAIASARVLDDREPASGKQQEIN